MRTGFENYIMHAEHTCSLITHLLLADTRATHHHSPLSSSYHYVLFKRLNLTTMSASDIAAVLDNGDVGSSGSPVKLPRPLAPGSPKVLDS